MTTLTTVDASDGTTIDASDLNNNLTAIKTVINGGIDNANISPGAGIAYSKLQLAVSIVNADISPSAAIALTKLGVGTEATLSFVNVAATDMLSNKLLAGDANQAFVLNGDGKLEWGAGGASALDANLYRSAANVLKSDDQIQATHFAVTSGYFNSDQQAGGSPFLVARASGDANNRFYVANDGTVLWGDGTAAQDTNLYRSAANTLKTDDQFQAALNVVAAVGSSDQVNVGVATGGGKITFGSAQDTNLYRSSADTLKTDDSFIAYGVYTQYGTASAIALSNDGKIYFHSSADTNLYRSAANTLKTDDNLHVVGNLTLDGSHTGVIPPGAIQMYAAAAAPSGYLLCDGTSYLRADYTDLFTAIGTQYGAVDGTHFNVPDLRGRLPVGKGTHADVDVLGDNDGAALADRRPGPGVTSGPSSTNQSTYDNPSGLTTHADTTHTHTIAKPSYLVVNFIIKT